MSSPSKYDVVVIGSGLGGLLTAVLLAKEGMKVAVLEKNKQIGGCLQTFSLQKKVFDSCVHYIGGLGDGHPLNRIFRYAGIMDKLILEPLDINGYDQIAFGDGGTTFPLACGEENFVRQLLPYFPEEERGLRKYLSLMQDVTSRFPMYDLRMGDPDEKVPVLGMELTETLASITNNHLLRQVLAGNNLLYAGRPGHTPFYMHTLVTQSYLHSAHKVVPGSSQIGKFLWQELQQHGGEIIRNTQATSFVAKNGKLDHVVDANGEHYYADHFIAAIHPALLATMLDNSLLRPAFHNRVGRLQQTKSAFCVNIVLKPGIVPYHGQNIYWHKQEDAFAGISNDETWPSTYAIYPTEDPSRKGFAETIAILTYMEYDWMKDWAATHNHTGEPTDRGADYLQCKEGYAMQLLEVVSRRYPEIAANMETLSVSTPLTYRDYTGTPTGALYGIMKDVQQPAATTIATRTRIPNLYLTGQNINLHGVLGVSITAIMTASELVGMEYLLKKINAC